MRLSIVIPAHNEEHRIGRMLDAYLPYFAEHYGEEAELLVVVNGSTDRTEDLVEAREAEHAMLRHIVEPERIGKGGAIFVGFQEARGEIIGFVDADGATAPESFDDIAKVCARVDAAIGSRWIKGAQVVIKQSLARRFASRCFNLCTRVLFGLDIHDTQCGAKAFRREAIAAVLPHLGTARWAFDVDLLYQIKRFGYRIEEVPTVWHDVKGSKLKVVRTSLGMFAALIRLRLVYSPFHRVVDWYTPRVDVFGRLKENPPL